MNERDLRPGRTEKWSKRYSTLRHAGEKREDDDDARLDNPADYSAIGGPEGEPAYGRSRNDDGYYPWNAAGGPHDRDTLESDQERGGFLKRRAPHTDEPLDKE